MFGRPPRSYGHPHRRLFWVAAVALTFVAACAAAGLLPITSFVLAVAISVALCAGRAQTVRRREP